MSRQEKTRILQVVGGMNRGGAETWLMHILRRLDPSRFQMDFLVHSPGPFDYSDEVRSLGGRFLVCEGARNPWVYRRRFNCLIRAHGPYHVVHAHLQHYNGLVLRLASAAGIAMRIAHSHLDTMSEQASAGLLRGSYLRLMNHWIDRYATHGYACSRKAAVALFGPAWELREDRQLMYCGIDLSAFRRQISRQEMRAALGIPEDAYVIGHAGRMVEQKNHKFLVQIFAEVARREPDTYLLLVGAGPLRGAIESHVRELGLSARVIFAGVQTDVPRLMLGAMDQFLFPSLYEGLPLVGMEVQAAGLPMIVADTVAPEVEVVPAMVKWMPLSSPAGLWADAVQSFRKSASSVTRDCALREMEKSAFNIERGVGELELVYSQSTVSADARRAVLSGQPEKELLHVSHA
jgi:glycosyltransferase involved in cell wall biosynthesis